MGLGFHVGSQAVGILLQMNVKKITVNKDVAQIEVSNQIFKELWPSPPHAKYLKVALTPPRWQEYTKDNFSYPLMTTTYRVRKKMGKKYKAMNEVKCLQSARHLKLREAIRPVISIRLMFNETSQFLFCSKLCTSTKFKIKDIIYFYFFIEKGQLEPELQIIAECVAAFRHNNEIRKKCGKPLTEYFFPCVTMDDTYPTFYKVKISEHLKILYAVWRLPRL
ncbi:hypothetical protein CONCODRAFT_7961 [Conidiobolus coronatus NRRL 28638]|uniref:Uncharacterized protein n=1 Tax=Conidiobolus coronatus (strain ATCC 28846 / CBS 209.66 / NRRL 28638) TaxID=796925 RepID=A0A137P3P5_CONC2|nr:hypothetical protein CONCODRAFT_7961 [Conidiobolus coronatus NRRL 28638]|eukprot:KXN69551.1 hypothetical protein CONCODRAFT_7961 [Conidiobolus coronatus NRRL 28638]